MVIRHHWPTGFEAGDRVFPDVQKRTATGQESRTILTLELHF
jgi:hypothetical protein